MKKTLILIVLLLLIPNVAQAQSISAVPGCDRYFNGYDFIPSRGSYMPTYRAWCGSDTLGWYDPTGWCMVSGYCFKDYGITDE